LLIDLKLKKMKQKNRRYEDTIPKLFVRA